MRCPLGLKGSQLLRFIPFNQPTLTGREQDYLAEVLASQKFSGDGPFSRRCQEWLRQTSGCAEAAGMRAMGRSPHIKDVHTKVQAKANTLQDSPRSWSADQLE